MHAEKKSPTRRGKRFDRNFYAKWFGFKKGNVTVLDAGCFRNPPRAYFVVECVCGTRWKTVIASFHRNNYRGRCGYGDCTAMMLQSESLAIAMTATTLGDCLRKLRLRYGKTLKDIASELRVSMVYLADVERGKRPPFGLNYLRMLASMFSVPVRALQRLAVKDRGVVEIPVLSIPPRALDFFIRLTCNEEIPNYLITALQKYLGTAKSKFNCCGGNDEKPRHHTSDCEDHPWKDKVDSRCVKNPKKCPHAIATRDGEIAYLYAQGDDTTLEIAAAVECSEAVVKKVIKRIVEEEENRSPTYEESFNPHTGEPRRC